MTHTSICPLDTSTEDQREQNRKTCEFIVEVERRLLTGDGVMAQLKLDLAENTAATKRVADSTSEMVDFFNSMIGAFKVLNWIGKLAMPIAAIIGLCTATWGAWMLFKNGGKP